MRCKGCGRSARNVKPQCWVNHQMCLSCACINFPKEYSRNVVKKATIHPTLPEIRKMFTFCTTCNVTLKKLAYHVKGKRISIDTGYCTECGTISVFDQRIKIQVAVR